MKTFSKTNAEDISFIGAWYEDVENGFKAIGKEYTRPSDWLDRAIRVLNTPRGKMGNQAEGRKGYMHKEE